MFIDWRQVLALAALLLGDSHTLVQAQGNVRAPQREAQWQRQGPSSWSDDGNLPVGPPAHMPRVTRVDVVCGKQHMTVQLEFNQPFHGIVFSKGKFSESQCVYVPPNSGQSRYTFDVRYDACGTKPDLHGNFYENTVVIQYGADVIEAWDEAKRLRCEWHEAYEKSAAGPPPIQLADLDVVELNFQGDSIDCWMEIQEGKGPWSREVSGLVPLGSPLTMVIAINDVEGQFDMRVKSCFAHDGRSVPVQLTDEWGCVLRPKLLSPFAKVRDYNGRATVVSYAHFYAFKFPDTMDVHVQCKVEVCRHGCPDVCQKTRYQPPAVPHGHSNGLDDQPPPLESKKVTVKASTHTGGGAYQDPRVKTQPEQNIVFNEEEVDVPQPEPIPGEGQKGRIVPPKAAQIHLQELQIKTHELLPEKPFEVQKAFLSSSDKVEVPFAHAPRPLVSPPLQAASELRPEAVVPIPEPEPQASVFQPVAAASTINHHHKQPGQLLLGKNPRSDSKAQTLFQGRPGEVSPQKQQLQRFTPPVLYKPPKPYYPYPIPQFVPPQPLFVKVTDRSDSAVVYRQAPNGGQPEFRRADVPNMPNAPPYRPPNPRPQGEVPFGFPQGPRSIRLRRSAADGEEIGVQQIYRAVASVDLAFEPNATLDGTPLHAGRKEDIVYGVCLPAVSLAVGLGFLLLMTVLSLCVCGYLAYQLRLQAMLKNSQTLLTAKRQTGGAFFFLYRNRAATAAQNSEQRKQQPPK